MSKETSTSIFNALYSKLKYRSFAQSKTMKDSSIGIYLKW